MTRCVVSFHFFLLLCFLVVEVFFHSISYLNRNISKKNFCFRDQQTPNKSFMKLFGYISGANEVTSKQPTHLSIKTWQMVFTKLTNTFFKGWGEDFHDSASVNQSYQCWGWRWLSAKVVWFRISLSSLWYMYYIIKTGLVLSIAIYLYFLWNNNTHQSTMCLFNKFGMTFSPTSIWLQE